MAMSRVGATGPKFDDAAKVQGEAETARKHENGDDTTGSAMGEKVSQMGAKSGNYWIAGAGQAIGGVDKMAHGKVAEGLAQTFLGHVGQAGAKAVKGQSAGEIAGDQADSLKGIVGMSPDKPKDVPAGGAAAQTTLTSSHDAQK